MAIVSRQEREPLDLRRRLADLSLPPPLETWIQRAVGPASVDRKHEGLVVAWEAACKVVAASMWAVCRRLGLRSVELDRHLRALGRPSFGHWAGLIRVCRGLLEGREEEEAQGLAPLLAGLLAEYAADEGLARLAERISLATEHKQPGGRTVLDLLQAMPAYRNITQSTHHHETQPGFREAGLEPLLEGLLGLCRVAPPLGAFEIAVVHRLERDEGGLNAELALFDGSFVTMQRCPLPEETWAALERGRPYLFAAPGVFVPLFPMVAAEPFEGSWRIGWLTGRVHAPTLAYQGGERGSFQVAVTPAEYEDLLGGYEAEARVPDEVLAMEPYRGLLAYEEEHEPLFFGREEEVEQALSRLDRAGVLVVCGASGSGKSSFMKAGIVPALRRRAADVGRDLVAVVLAPGAEPFSALRRALRAAGPQEAVTATRWSKLVGELMPADPEQVAHDAVSHGLRGLAAEGREVVLCVDQLEEVVTQVGDQAIARRFLDLFVATARAREGPVHLVATVRADLVGRLLEHEGFRSLLDEHALHLGGIAPSRLERVITEPLRGRRVGVEPGLPERIVADIAEQPGAVALLSQVLKTLWEERAAHGNKLTKQGYEDAGCVAGALRTQADAARAEVIEAGEDAVVLDGILSELAHHDPDHGFARRRMRLGPLAEAVELDAVRLGTLLGPFVRRRLLVLSKSEGKDGTETVEVAHEALLTSWPHLADLLRAQEEAIALRQEIEVTAAAWEGSGRRRELWTDATTKLARAEELLAAGRLALPARERAFLRTSRDAVRRRRRLERAVAGALAILLVLAGSLFLQAEASERVATARAEEFDLLSVVQKREDFMLQEAGLFPPWPENIAPMEEWLRGSRNVLDQRGEIEAAIRRFAGRENASDAQRFLAEELNKVLPGLDELAELRSAMRSRLRWAGQIAALSRSHPNARHSWSEARAAIAKADGVVASEWYAGQDIPLRDDQVMGLVPIGKNPKTGLWEFYHLRSACDGTVDPRDIEIPEHAEDGSLDVTESTGIVLVLVPGGSFRMGGGEDPIEEDELSVGPPVALDAFLLSRYELTQAQWMRLGDGTNPSAWKMGGTFEVQDMDLTHPVESVSWHACERLMRNHGLDLPTEAQWEYAARARTTSRWWTGDEDSLRGACNLADARYRQVAGGIGLFHDWDDGWAGPAPVDTFPANAFGLHNVHGNVLELCQDWKCSYATAPEPGTGLRTPDQPGPQTDHKVMRGGSFQYTAVDARSANRMISKPGSSADGIGVRPARLLRD